MDKGFAKETRHFRLFGGLFCPRQSRVQQNFVVWKSTRSALNNRVMTQHEMYTSEVELPLTMQTPKALWTRFPWFRNPVSYSRWLRYNLKRPPAGADYRRWCGSPWPPVNLVSFSLSNKPPASALEPHWSRSTSHSGLTPKYGIKYYSQITPSYTTTTYRSHSIFIVVTPVSWYLCLSSQLNISTPPAGYILRLTPFWMYQTSVENL